MLLHGQHPSVLQYDHPTQSPIAISKTNHLHACILLVPLMFLVLVTEEVCSTIESGDAVPFGAGAPVVYVLT
jgi:hypothetical protein